MLEIKFKSKRREEEKELGNVAMFGYGIGDHERRGYSSGFFLPNVVIGGLEIFSVVFLLLILCEFIPVRYLVYILAPLALTFVFASADLAIEEFINIESLQKLSHFSEHAFAVTALLLACRLIVFGAKCALIYMYSKNLNEVVSATQSLTALADISIDQAFDAVVPTKYFLISVVFILMTIIPEIVFAVVMGRRLLERKHFEDAIRHTYAFVLSLVDTLALSIFFFIHRWMDQQKEIVHFNKIINNLPILFIAVASARCLVWLVIPFVFAKKEDRRCVYPLGLVHLCVAAANVISYMLTDSHTLFKLKVFCFTAITERFLMICINVYLGSIKRTARRLKEKKNSSLIYAYTGSGGDGSNQHLLDSPASSPSRKFPPMPKKGGSAALPVVRRSVSDANGNDDDSRSPRDGQDSSPVTVGVDNQNADLEQIDLNMKLLGNFGRNLDELDQKLNVLKAEQKKLPDLPRDG